MIISHEHRFIFVKTRKTAGTSIEVFLADHVEPGAIVTPVKPPVAGHVARNHRRVFNPVPEMLRTRHLVGPTKAMLRRNAFYNHIDAQRIRDRVGARIWDSYFKFCFERDPWDKVVSQFYFRRSRTDVETPATFREFVLQGPLVTDWSLYSLDGRPAMDFIGRFEHLEDDLREAMTRIGIDATVELSREKSASRSDPTCPTRRSRPSSTHGSRPCSRARSATSGTATDRGPRTPMSVEPPAKILITGTGRAGTTLLVQILTDLGLDTGFAPDAPIDERTHAGLELPLDDPAGPRIVKSPTAIRRLDGLLASGRLRLEHVVVPMRDLDVAAASRVRNTRYGADLASPGGLLGTRSAIRQREALALLQYELMYTLARYDVPNTLLVFPRFASDWRYLADRLAFLDPTIPPERWRAAVERRADPTLIHETPLSPDERRRARLGTVYNRFVVRPARAVRTIVRDRGVR